MIIIQKTQFTDKNQVKPLEGSKKTSFRSPFKSHLFFLDNPVQYIQLAI